MRLLRRSEFVGSGVRKRLRTVRLAGTLAPPKQYPIANGQYPIRTVWQGKRSASACLMSIVADARRWMSSYFSVHPPRYLGGYGKMKSFLRIWLNASSPQPSPSLGMEERENDRDSRGCE